MHFIYYCVHVQVVPAFVALSFIGWIVFVAGFGKEYERYVVMLCSVIQRAPRVYRRFSTMRSAMKSVRVLESYYSRSIHYSPGSKRLIMRYLTNSALHAACIKCVIAGPARTVRLVRF